MISRWSKYKEKAIGLRKQGFSIRQIEKKLEIPRSTLSNWFKKIKLNKRQRNALLRNWQRALSKARKWHQNGINKKTKRIQTAKQEAITIINNLNLKDNALLELAIAMLYFGEGTKILRNKNVKFKSAPS